MTNTHTLSTAISKLLELDAKRSKGTWSWERDEPLAPGMPVTHTVYAGRIDPIGEWNGVSVCGHGMNLFGRMYVDWNGVNNLDYICAAPLAISVIKKQQEMLEQYKGLLELALALKGGWREAITMLEDYCSDPVRLKNMMAAADQLDNWSKSVGQSLSADVVVGNG